MTENINVLIVGVGGQGTLFAGKVIGEVAEASGLSVKQSEVHGMAQRGGSVVTYVRIGEQVISPLVEKGEADIIVSFEQLEALRWIEFLKPNGTVIVNEQMISPMPVIIGAAKYPTDIFERLERAGVKMVRVNAVEMAAQCGNPKAVNIVLLGMLAKRLPMSQELWLGAIADQSPAAFKVANLEAFNKGWNIA
jgi:indolepyruvate ferredoxin oxidoreductase beta subunit